MYPNTVARAYRELEHEGVIELRHASGAFVSESVVGRTKVMPKLMLLSAICHRADLLILDEPTDGLDPVGVEERLRSGWPAD